MRIHILSDIHNEFAPYSPSDIDADLVILAGDIGVGVRGIEWAKQAFSCPVLYVSGNHEFFGGHLDQTLEAMRQAGSERVRVMDCDEAIIGGVRFLGATGWTDYTATGNEPIAAWDAQRVMRDFEKIVIDDGRKVTLADFALRSRIARDWLADRLAEPFDGKTVVVTHHAPSLASVQGSPGSGSHLDAAFANRWEFLMGPEIALWVHGHTHHAVDYDIAGTRIISNPKGYPGENTGFAEDLVIALD
jgi:predicted phosphodiesterase